MAWMWLTNVRAPLISYRLYLSMVSANLSSVIVFSMTLLIARAVLTALYLGGRVEGLAGFLLPFAAGNFVYIAGCDLVPELLDQKGFGKGLSQFGLMALGVLLMYLVKLF